MPNGRLSTSDRERPTDKRRGFLDARRRADSRRIAKGTGVGDLQGGWLSSSGMRHSAVVQSSPIEQSWIRLINWLERHAPVSFRALRPGADDAEIDQLEADLEVALP